MSLILIKLKNKSQQTITLIFSMFILSMVAGGCGIITSLETQLAFASFKSPVIHLECIGSVNCNTGQDNPGPKGDTGAQGPQGETGPAGKDGAPCPNTTTLHNRQNAGGNDQDPSNNVFVHDANHTANPIVCVP